MAARRAGRSLALAAALAGAPLLLSYADGPLPQMTGGFGEPSCHSCHFDRPLDPPGARLAVAGFPPSYTPGRRYRFSVRLETRESHLGERGGFELAVRYAEGESAGAQAGRLAAGDERVRVIEAGEPRVQYAQHTLAGATPREGGLAWAVEWTAPDQPAHPVLLHVAANAADGDDSPLGDRVYLVSLQSAPAGAP
jgi:hypothetical protein